MEADTPKLPVYRKPRVRTLARFSLCLAVVGMLLAVITNLGFYINGDFIPDEVRGPHPVAGTLGKLSLIVGFFVIPAAGMLSFLSLPLAFFRAPRVANLVVALMGVLISFLAWSLLLASGLPRVKSNPGRFHAKEVTKLGSIIREYARGHDGHLPPAANWCDALAQFDPNATDYLACRALDLFDRGPKNLSTLALNTNVKGRRLADVPPDVVLLFGTNPAQNPVGDRKLLTADEYEGKGALVLFADLHIEFVKVSRFGTLRWEP